MLTSRACARRRSPASDFRVGKPPRRGERPHMWSSKKKIAQFYGVDAAVCFVSGYLTMSPHQLPMGAEGPRHPRRVHPQQRARRDQAFRRGTPLLQAQRHRGSLTCPAHRRRVTTRILVIVEGIYSMDGDVANLPAASELRAEYGFWLMVDEAHSLESSGRTAGASPNIRGRSARSRHLDGNIVEDHVELRRHT